MAMAMKSAVLWDFTRCSLVEVSLYFRQLYCLHFHSRKINQTITRLCLLLALLFISEDGRSAVT
jgi:hypothetical protein